eukprot:6856141-Alexandrium_andersonii.AAC.1
MPGCHPTRGGRPPARTAVAWHAVQTRTRMAAGAVNAVRRARLHGRPGMHTRASEESKET